MNIQVVTEENTTEAVGAVESNELVTEASTLGIGPGRWPTELQTTLGNKLPFALHLQTVVDGETTKVKYKQVAGSLMLTVFND
jgi:hypothetical protein